MRAASGLPDQEKREPLGAVGLSASRLMAAATLLLLTGLIAACSSSADKTATARANATQAVQVTVATVQRQDLPIYLDGLGSAEAYFTVNVRSRVDGQLVQVNFREGESVKKGDLLAVIDPRPYQVQLDQAQATLFKDQASLRDAQLNYQRYKELLQDSGAMSQQQVDTQKATADQLEGTVRSDQATVDNAKLNLTYCHITAPESGRIGLRLVDPGNIVHATDTNALLVIAQLQPITVIFTLPEDQLQEVSKRLQKGPLPVDAYSRDDETKIASGKLLTIDNEIDQTTGTGRLKAIFDNVGNELWPNQFVNIHLLLDTKKGAIVIPSAAVQRGPQGSYVYVVKPDNTVAVTAVTIGVTEGNVAQIDSGLSPNQTVVTDGQDKLQDNSRVQTHTQAANGGGLNPVGTGNPKSGNPASPNGGVKMGQGTPGQGNPGPGDPRQRNRKGADAQAPNSGSTPQ